MMYYIYVLKSLLNGDMYIGYSTNLKIRFGAHNYGKVKSTKAYRPWVLVYYEAYRAKSDATKREKQLKMHAVKQDLLKKLASSINMA